MSKRWTRSTRYFVAFLLLIGTGWLLLAIQPLLSPLAISALLAYVLNPAVNFVNTRTKLRRSYVVLLVFGIAVAIITLTVALVAPILPAQAQGLSDNLQEIVVQIETAMLQPVVVLGFTIPLDQLVATLPDITTTATTTDLVLSVIQSTTTNLAWVSIVIVTTYYLLQDWPRLREWILNLAPHGYSEDMRLLYFGIRDVWERYRSGQLRLMFWVGLLSGVGMALIGLPGAAVFGIFAGLLDVVLSVGPALVTVVAAAVAYFFGSTWLNIPNIWFALLVVGVFVGVQMIENVWLRPRIMGQNLKMHPAVVFIAVIGALALAGILMALIIVPLIGSAMVVFRYLYCRVFDLDPWQEDRMPLVRPSAETAESPQAAE